MNLYDKIFYILYLDTLKANNYFIPLHLTIIHMAILTSFYINALLFFCMNDISLIINIYSLSLSVILHFVYFFRRNRYEIIIKELTEEKLSDSFKIITKVIFYSSYAIPIVLYILYA